MSLPKEILDEIIRIVSKFKKVEKLLLFGSRATGDFKKASDIDLAIFGSAVSDRDMALMQDELEEKVITPLQFDIVHFDTLTKENLKNDILKEGIVLYES